MDDSNESVEVQGLDELAYKLDNMPYKFAARIQRTALQAGGEVFAAEERARCPVAPKASHPDSEPGEMRDAIQVKVKLGKNLDDSTCKVGPGYDKARFGQKGKTSHSPGVYVKFVEYGTATMNPEAFMRPAFDAAKEAAQEAYTQVVSDLIDLLTDGTAGGDANVNMGFEE